MQPAGACVARATTSSAWRSTPARFHTAVSGSRSARSINAELTQPHTSPAPGMHTRYSTNHIPGTGAGAINSTAAAPTATAVDATRAVIGRCQHRRNIAMNISGIIDQTCAATCS